MESFSIFGFKIFSVIAGLISPIVSILIGIALRRVEDVFFLINSAKEEAVYSARGQKTIQLLKLIGLLMIIYGSLRLVDNIYDFIRFFLRMIM